MESIYKELTGIARELSVTSSWWYRTVLATSFVRIESKSIVQSAKRCIFLKAAIDLMEPTLAHH